MTSVLHYCARKFARFGLQLRDRVRRTLSKSAQASDVDPRAAWEAYFKSFCQVVTASGAHWTCDGYGDWRLLKSYPAPLETAVDELLECLGMPGRLDIGNSQEQIVATVTARHLAAAYRLGLLLPMEHLKRADEAKRCHGNEARIGCTECQRRESEYAYCHQRSDHTHRQCCAIERVLNCFSYFEFHGGSLSVDRSGDDQHNKEQSPHHSNEDRA